MSRIQPISTTRVTDAMARGRLTSTIQNHQLELFRLQTQLSTGYRIFQPSDDAAAAQRAMALQRTIERKEQSATNLLGARLALVNAESSLEDVSDGLNNIKSSALNAIETVASEEERDNLIEEIDLLVRSITKVGNASFTGSFVFGGTQIATPPYEGQQTYVEYFGDEGTPQTFVDLGYLFASAIPGDQALGGLSEGVRGAADLDPQLTPNTLLADVNGGEGISANPSVVLTFVPASSSDPTTSSIVDLSRADSVADVARLLEEGAPAGAELTVSVRGQSLVVETAGGTLSIGEAPGGNTANELGVLQTTPSASIVGRALDPVLRVTTPLSDLAGTKARGLLRLAGDNNDLSLVAATNGASVNGLTVTLVDGATLGGESAVYNAGANTLTVTIDADDSSAAHVAAAINAEGTFAATTDHHDALSYAAQGGGLVVAQSVAGVTAGGAGGALDLASGLRVTNGDTTYAVDTSSVETVEDLLNLLNRSEYGLVAAINQRGDGLDVRSRRSGADFSIGENGGQTATQLGLRTYTTSSRLADFNRGVGVVVEANGSTTNLFRIEVTDNGVTTPYDVDLTGANTVGDVVTRVATATGGTVTAALATVGNGLTLTASAAAITPAAATGTVPLAGDTLTVTASATGTAGDRPFTFEVTDSGASGVSISVIGDAITINLGGATPTTDQLAAALQTQLTGYTVSSSGTATVAGPAAVAPLNVAGGVNGSAAGVDQLRVSGGGAERLGFFADGATEATSTTSTLTSTDRNPLEVDSVFTTLLRMRQALEADDMVALSAETRRLDDDLDRASFARSELGARVQTLDAVKERLADEDVQLRDALSLEIDADLVEVISDYTSRQYTLQASLKTAGTLLNLSILDFI